MLKAIGYSGMIILYFVNVYRDTNKSKNLLEALSAISGICCMTIG
jgi:hypothetical protein